MHEREHYLVNIFTLKLFLILVFSDSCHARNFFCHLLNKLESYFIVSESNSFLMSLSIPQGETKI